jgi:large subunit ribosomal protein L24
MVKIKQGDTVEVIRGDDRGMRGTVRVVDPRKNRIIVEGVNVAVKHQRAVPAGSQQTQGGRIEVEIPIDASKVMLICPSCQERTRVGYVRAGYPAVGSDSAQPGRGPARKPTSGKVRVCKKCNANF